ncbi:aspartyl-phosphate phosphatase Spo0E family protein [Desulfitobacterium sp.]|uniref:aspartyl-phosphate phosphatase Spo0E family protein n=1 Tax=Desulfitobacterium sp. TaxID=49981 RepID=UPI002B219759|nr:aspartyl-phosphate phosphatase Spo0E family protein [Desulfitobacterium sp.]MEA4902646.1 aspartyl-phosphate phosphatase Spo0E family protein [Desulfitobacterium sp.]
MEQLKICIEKLRLSLYEVAQEKALTDPEVVQLSQLLDTFLNEYQQKSTNTQYKKRFH